MWKTWRTRRAAAAGEQASCQGSQERSAKQESNLASGQAFVVIHRKAVCALRRDFFAHPLAGLLESILHLCVTLSEAGFNIIPGGLRGALGSVKLFVQLGCLLAERLKLGFSFGFGRVAGLF